MADDDGRRKEDGTVTIARITAWQAIVVAAIAFAGTVFAALIGAGYFSDDRSSEATGGTQSNRPAIAEAPHIHIFTRFMDRSVEDCVATAYASLQQAKMADGRTDAFTGVRRNETGAFGYQGPNIGFFFCDAASRSVITITAGEDYDEIVAMNVLMQRLF